MKFYTLKKAIIKTFVIVSSNSRKPFESICDASDNVVGVVLGQRHKKVFHYIYIKRFSFHNQYYWAWFVDINGG